MKFRASELRRNQTPAERELWKRLRLRRVCGVRFLRQYVIGHYILDFYAPSTRLAVELDGGQHYESDVIAHDATRRRWFAARGIEVLRYTNLDVSRRIDDVLIDIERAVARLRQHPPAASRRPPSFRRG
ncbi:MAG: endonuclease domain-containing protein [Rhodanobacteraceae bacterium]|nr:MAG: endonuclease domain-containing protein [Rhodanobacteraceae bacterium]